MWYLKKKFWAALIAGIAAGVSYYTGNAEIGNAVTAIGVAVIAALGLEDLGKAAKKETVSIPSVWDAEKVKDAVQAPSVTVTSEEGEK